ncbi:spore germination protein [Thermaerobacter subterraneus]|uniref:GerA spore germination protein n=1 Tax=Thermaerobacter subterraneus DSM 13965 TaxID=867903 RepID=K6Q253_9FIRM|nr:spore germination protein [Thermaerobacter subterraneus]EKP95278.1 GerA spore germination protein [Thermaerobacter subterraneus DSM 13965]
MSRSVRRVGWGPGDGARPAGGQTRAGVQPPAGAPARQPVHPEAGLKGAAGRLDRLHARLPAWSTTPPGGRPPLAETPATRLREHLEDFLGRMDRWVADLALEEAVPAEVRSLEALVRDALGHAADLVTVPFRRPGGAELLVMYVDGLVGDTLLNQFILRPLLERLPATAPQVARWLDRGLLPGGRVRPVTRLTEAVDGLLDGCALIAVDAAGGLPAAGSGSAPAAGAPEQGASGAGPAATPDGQRAGGVTTAWLVDVQEFEHRGVDAPATEGTIGGPREAFVEVLRVNTATLRRRLRTPYLRIEELETGRLSRTRAAVVHVAGRADPGTVALVRRRLEAAPWDMLFSEEQVEALLQDRPLSLFPQTRLTERPDVVAAGLMEGRVAVLIDGTPFAVVVPLQFWDLLQSPDDYYLRWPFASILRMVRLIAVLLMTVGLPLYVAVTTYNQELIPREFLFSLAASREALPFPTALEAVGLSFVFDILREATTRLPRQVGGALTIVGGLVIGDTAVRAGIVTAPTLILIGVSAMAAFALPTFAAAIPFRVLHYVFLGVATVLGMYGLVTAFLIVLAHMVSLRSVGVPYLTPYAPYRPQGWEDALVRAPWAMMRGKPPLIGREGAGAGAGQ